MERYLKYEGFPYKHLGDNPDTGIDCFNLVRWVYKHELGIEISLSTADFCSNPEEKWYIETNNHLFGKPSAERAGFRSVKTPKEYDMIIMSIGTTNIANHCALYLGKDKISFWRSADIFTRHILPVSSYYTACLPRILINKMSIHLIF